MSRAQDKIAFFLPSLCSGGAEKVTITLSNEFAKRGLRTELLLAQAEGPYLGDILPGVTVVDLKSSRVVNCVPKLAKYLHTAKPACLLSALSHANVTAVVARIVSHAHSRLVVAEHTTPSLSRMPSISSRVVKCLIGWAYRHADKVVAVSQGVKDDLCSLGVPKNIVSTVYNPIVSNDLFLKANETCPHPWFQPGAAPVALAVGRLEETKDFALLIRAFARVRRSKRVNLAILGEGSARPHLEALIATLRLEDCVSLLGFVSNPYCYMRNAAVFVSSSKREGFGNAVVEALACGVPVVSTNCPGPNEILCNGKWGIIVPIGDVKALAAAIEDALGNTLLQRRELVERAKRFSVESAADKYLECLLGKRANVERLGDN